GNGVIIINTSIKYIRNNPYSKAILSKDFYAKGYSYPPVFATPIYDKKKQNRILEKIHDLFYTGMEA
ncbi:MAG: hypothetical protein M3015_15575, partial [Bacteroidota bacterium]|nr:hypothetical protein [Bacteroidota bacterium]